MGDNKESYLICAILQEFEEYYPTFLEENGITNTPLYRYLYYSMAFSTVEEQDDLPEKKAKQVIMEELALRSTIAWKECMQPFIAAIKRERLQ